ncbi:hypothetical protein [Pseudomonas oryzihabitans]|uniref:Uncharacterized protein n=1 Tax=Pseudomonas oryzihabitans TaxID=47885 RepID=A0AAJ2BQZ9_9PSED|nr:hypothetical protein [Pseudomonas psychrotolerans]MDR6236912.1 hypothetical protein [Pseudomonas psychrotolerans]MDR6353655.1 hypothetical protein [Pseudomonas psychrotolerans]
MTDLAFATQAELTFAEQVFEQLRQALPKSSRARDPLVIAAVGELQVRLAAARALQRASAADDGPVRQIQARLAADSARQLAAELQREWLGGAPSQRPLGAAPRDLKRLLGEHHLTITD